MFLALKHPYKRADGSLTLDAFVKRGSLFVGAAYWRLIEKEFGRDDIKEAIVAAKEDNALPLPGAIDEFAMRTDYRALLALNASKIIHQSPNVITRHDYDYGLSPYYLTTLNTGNKASDYFHRHNRMKVSTRNFISPQQTWEDSDKLFYCLRALWSILKVKELNPMWLFQCIALRQYVAAQFRASSAKALYTLFDARNVLDTSAGWGDRFAGFSAAKNTEFYLGIDPNSALHEGYWGQARAYNSDKHQNFLCAPAEDVDLGVKQFDFAFTSPPYFETERYSEEETQSWKRYKKLDSWLYDFLLPVVTRTYAALERGGVMAVNIADLGVSYDEVGICDTMNKHIATMPGSNYMGCLGLRLASRPNTSLKKRDGAKPPVFVEPIWIWRKGEGKSIEQLVRRPML